MGWLNSAPGHRDYYTLQYQINYSLQQYMEEQSSFEMAVEDNGFFDDLGGGILISKKEERLRNQIVENSRYISQNTLDDRIKKHSKNIKPIVQDTPNKHATRIQQNIKSNEPTNRQKATKQSDKPKFQDLKLIKPILKVVSELEFTHPTPVQAASIPAILSGKDVMVSSITGSGKTAAFLIPVLQRYYNAASTNYSRVLILTPTRELAIQCYEMFQALNKYCKLGCCLAIGASSIQKQESQLSNFPELVIGTPGRVLDLLANSRSFGLEHLQMLVFDEADKLLEYGFQAEIKEIIGYLNRNCQNLLFSATFGEQVNKLASYALKKPIRLSVDPDNSTARKLHQQVFRLSNDDQDYREAVLLTTVSNIYKDKVIVFFKTKKQCHRMAILLNLLGLKSCQLHGNLSQTQRITAFNHFKEGKYDYLLATDLASRGLDIKQVQTVINYELPTQLTRYIHRVGRTARAGNAGTSLTLCTDKEAQQLKKMMKKTKDQLFKLSLSEQLIKDNQSVIRSLEKSYREIIEEERKERQLRLAEMQLKKLENVEKHSEQIYNRPKKTWFISQKQKSHIRKESKRMALGEAEDTEGRGPKRHKRIAKNWKK